MKRQDALGVRSLALIFLRTGSQAFGGWSSTALLLEKELVDHRKLITKVQLDGAVAYAQILPGATQVAIVSNLGYRLGGIRGALLSTSAYLTPAIGLILVFSVVYFHFISGTQFMNHMGGLIAALGGLILANAYHIGKRHVTRRILWVLVAGSGIANLWFGVTALLIITGLGLAGLTISFFNGKVSLHE